MAAAVAVVWPTAASPQGTTASGAPVVIHAATLLDGRGASTRNAYVVVRNGKIDRVSTSPVSVPGAATIELGQATLLPGLIDAHVHPGWYVDRNGKRNSQRSGDTPRRQRSRARATCTRRSWPA